MKCRQAEEWMDAALDVALAGGAAHAGEGAVALPNGWRGHLEAHLNECPGCRQLWSQLHAADAALRMPRPVAAPTDLLPEFRRRMTAETATERSRRAPWFWIWPAGSMAAGVAAAWIIAVHVAPLPVRVSVTAPQASRGEAGRPRVPPVSHSHAEIASGRWDTATPRVAVPPARERPALQQRVAVKREHARPEAPPMRIAAAPPSPDLLDQPGPGPVLEAEIERTPADAQRKMPAGVRAPAGTPAPNRREILQGIRVGPPTARVTSEDRREDYQYRASGEPGRQPDPPELRVSPVVLTALQRTVDVQAPAASVRQVAEELSSKADVRVDVDPQVALRSVTVREAGVPLWRALEAVARQTGLQVLPVENHLLLTPAPARRDLPLPVGAAAGAVGSGVENAPRNQAAPGPVSRAKASNPTSVGAQFPRQTPSLAGSAAGAGGFAGNAAASGGGSVGGGLGGGLGARPALAAPAGPSGPLAARKEEARAPAQGSTASRLPGALEEQLRGTTRARSALQSSPARPPLEVSAPDRTVWPEQWGTLPERGFAVPTTAEIPPQAPPPAAAAGAFARPGPPARRQSVGASEPAQAGAKRRGGRRHAD